MRPSVELFAVRGVAGTELRVPLDFDTPKKFFNFTFRAVHDMVVSPTTRVSCGTGGLEARVAPSTMALGWRFGSLRTPSWRSPRLHWDNGGSRALVGHLLDPLWDRPEPVQRGGVLVHWCMRLVPIPLATPGAVAHDPGRARC